MVSIGYDYNQFPDNVDEIIELCNDAVDALYAVNGYRFTCINSAELCKSTLWATSSKPSGMG